MSTSGEWQISLGLDTSRAEAAVRQFAEAVKQAFSEVSAGAATGPAAPLPPFRGTQGSVDDVVREQRIAAREQLQIQRGLAADPGYTRVQGELAAVLKRRANKEALEELRATTATDLGREAVVNVTRARQRLARQLAEEGAVTGEDIRQRGLLASTRARTATQVGLETLRGITPEDTRERGGLAAGRGRQLVQEQLAREAATTEEDIKERANLSATTARRAAQEQALTSAQKAVDEKYLTAKASAAVNAERERTQVGLRAASLRQPEDIEKQAQLNTSQRQERLYRQTLEEGSVTEDEIRARANLAALTARHGAQQAALAEEEKLSDREYIEATAKATAARQRQAAALARFAAEDVTPEDLQYRAGTERKQALNKAQLQQFRAASYSPEDLQAIGGGAAAAASQKEAVSAARLAALADQSTEVGQQYLAAKTESALSQQRLNESIKIETLAQRTSADQARTSQLFQAEKRSALEQQIIQLREILGIQGRELTAERSIVELEGEAALLQRQYNVAKREATRAARNEIVGAPQPTIFQRLYARAGGLRGESEREPIESPTLRQFLGGKFLTTAGFALSGAATYGAFQGITTMIKQAQDLEKVMNQIRAQFESIGQGNQFAGFSAAILDISKETGETAKDVAFVAFQMKGAFGDTTLAVQQTESAIKIARVTGLALTDVVDSLTAASLSFGAKISTVGDLALGIQERLGVLAKETIKAVADLAPVANDVGLSLKQTTALVGVAQQVTARPGSAIAESFGRILPALQEHRFELAQIYAQNPKLAASYNEITQAIGQGKMGVVLDNLIRNWDKLDKVQQNDIITLLGGRREAQTLIAVLQNQGKYVDEMSGKYNDAGKTTKYFSDLQKTLSQQMAELKARFVEFGAALFQAGLGDFLKEIVSTGSRLFDLLAKIGNVFKSINDATGGFAGRIVLITASMAGLNRILNALLAKRGIEGLSGLFSGIGGAVGMARFHGSFAAGEAGLEGAGVLGRGAAYAGGAGSALLGSIGLSTTTLGVGAVLAAGFTYKSFADRAVADAKKLHEEFRNQQKYSVQKLKDLADDDQSFWGDMHNLFFGSQSRASVAQAELRRRASLSDYQQFHAVYRQGLFTQGGVPGALTGSQLLQAVGLPASGVIPRRGASPQQQAIYNTLNRIGISPESVAGGKALDPAVIAKIDKAVGEGVKGAAGLMDAIINFYRSNGPRAQLLQAALTRISSLQTRKDKLDFITGDAQNAPESVQTAQSLQQQYQSGQISGGAYGVGLQAILKVYKDTNSLKMKDAIALQKQINDFYSTQAQTAVEMQNNLAQVTGAPDVTQQNVGRLVALLKDPRFTNPQQRLQAANEIVGMMSALKDERAKTASTVQEELNILEHGIEIPKEAREALIEEQIRSLNPVMSEFIAAWANGNQTLADTMTRELAIAIAGGKTAFDALIANLKAQAAVIQKEIDDLLKVANAIGLVADVGGDFQRLQAELNNINAEIAKAEGIGADAFNQNIGAPTTAGGGADDKEKARQAREQQQQADAANKAAQQAQRQAQITKDTAGQHDPVKLAQAQKALADATADAARAQLDAANAQMASANQITEPVARQLAQTAAATAQINAVIAILNAQTAQINADHGLKDAVQAANQSRFDLAHAVAESLQDVVGAARIDVQKAADQLNYDVANNAGEAQVNQDRANLVTAQANAAQVARQNTESIIDFNLQAHRITTAQAIAQLTLILNTLDQGTQEYRDLFLRIQALKDQTNQDLQFDVPTNLDISGLFYQSRRALESERAGSGYQDNRNQNVTIHAYNAGDYQDAIDQTVEQFSARPRIGVNGKRY